MARRSRPTPQKRNKEMARQQKQKDKMARRLEAKERKINGAANAEGKGLDVAGLQPGPQPLPEQWDYTGSAD